MPPPGAPPAGVTPGPAGTRAFLNGGAGCFRLLSDTVTVGRGPACDIVLASASVSKLHARLHLNGPQDTLLIDLNSKNGTFVNGRRYRNRDARLAHGDIIRFGFDKGSYRIEFPGAPRLGTYVPRAYVDGEPGSAGGSEGEAEGGPGGGVEDAAGAAGGLSGAPPDSAGPPGPAGPLGPRDPPGSPDSREGLSATVQRLPGVVAGGDGGEAGDAGRAGAVREAGGAVAAADALDATGASDATGAFDATNTTGTTGAAGAGGRAAVPLTLSSDPALFPAAADGLLRELRDCTSAVEAAAAREGSVVPQGAPQAVTPGVPAPPLPAEGLGPLFRELEARGAARTAELRRYNAALQGLTDALLRSQAAARAGEAAALRETRERVAELEAAYRRLEESTQEYRLRNFDLEDFARRHATGSVIGHMAEELSSYRRREEEGREPGVPGAQGVLEGPERGRGADQAAPAGSAGPAGLGFPPGPSDPADPASRASYASRLADYRTCILLLRKDFSELVQETGPQGQPQARAQAQEIISRMSSALASARLREAALVRSLYEEHKLAAELKLALEQAEARLADSQAQLSYALSQRQAPGPSGAAPARPPAASAQLPSVPSLDEFSVREAEYWDMREQLEAAEAQLEQLRASVPGRASDPGSGPGREGRAPEDRDEKSGLTYREIIAVLLARLDELSGSAPPAAAPLRLK